MLNVHDEECVLFLSAALGKRNIWCAKRVKGVARREGVKRRAVIRASWRSIRDGAAQEAD